MLSVPNRRARVFVLALRPAESTKKLALPQLYGHLVLAMPAACIELGVTELMNRRLMMPLPLCKQCVSSQQLCTLNHTATFSTDTGSELWDNSVTVDQFLVSDEGHPIDGACTAQDVQIIIRACPM